MNCIPGVAEVTLWERSIVVHRWVWVKRPQRREGQPVAANSADRYHDWNIFRSWPERRTERAWALWGRSGTFCRLERTARDGVGPRVGLNLDSPWEHR